VTNRACRPDIFWRREGDRPVMSRAVVSFWAPEYAASAARDAIHRGTKMPSPPPYETPRSSDFWPHFSPHFPVDFSANFPRIRDSRIVPSPKTLRRRRPVGRASQRVLPYALRCLESRGIARRDGGARMAAAISVSSRCHHGEVTASTRGGHVERGTKFWRRRALRVDPRSHQR